VRVVSVLSVVIALSRATVLVAPTPVSGVGSAAAALLAVSVAAPSFPPHAAASMTIAAIANVFLMMRLLSSTAAGTDAPG
jgi:hypothetical protein